MDTIRVLIADDHPVVRGGLRMAIAEDPLLAVIGEAANGKLAIETARKLLPDVAILDIGMPLVDGIAGTRQIKIGSPGTSVIILTAHDGEDLFQAAMDAGANGYLMKDNALLEITTAIRAVSNGGCYFTQSMARHLVKANAAGPVAARRGDWPVSELTPMETRLLSMVAAHLSNKEIANALGLSVRTVENRRAAICEKLGLTGLNALLKFALEHKTASSSPR